MGRTKGSKNKKNLSPTQEVTMPDSPQKPTEEQIQEVIHPLLSKDSFQIGEREFSIQILPIAYEKKIALALSPILKQLDSFSDKSLGEIFKENGAEVIINFQDALIEVVLVICQRYDSSVDRKFIEENAITADLLPIIIKQLEKNKIADMVSSFFFKVATLNPKILQSQKS